MGYAWIGLFLGKVRWGFDTLLTAALLSSTMHRKRFSPQVFSYHRYRIRHAFLIVAESISSHWSYWWRQMSWDVCTSNQPLEMHADGQGHPKIVTRKRF
jgi:hypothetical protein